MKAMMRQMGMSQTDIDATEVIIKCKDKEIVFNAPSVQKVVMKGQATFQISGDYVERDLEVEVQISEEDINMVIEQTGVDKEEALKALKKTKGDIAEAIINLSE
jgi:nascent polypeptide-associated complex subunit alpha